MRRAFVLGNGTSRENINSFLLSNYGTVYGCNAVYRDFLPDHLVAVDSKMLDELVTHNIQEKTNIWTNHRRNYEKYSNINFIKPSKGWSSGPTALWLASTHGYEEIYIIGFDYLGTEDNLINNIYAGTNNYRSKTDSATFYGNWKKQTETVLQEFKTIKYYRIINSARHLNFEWSKFKNYSSIDIENFKKLFNV